MWRRNPANTPLAARTQKKTAPNTHPNSQPYRHSFDDGWNSAGPTEEDPGAVKACGLSPQDVLDLVAAYKLSYAEKINATIAHGGFVFDKLSSPAPPNATSAQPQCAPFLRAHCGAGSPSQAGPLLLQFSRQNHTHPWPLPYPAQDLATFLLVRGEYSWLGYAWAGCYSPGTYERPPGLDVEYGTPLGFCAETAPGSGVFTRNFTLADVALDCNTFEATIQPRGLAAPPPPPPLLSHPGLVHL